MLETRDQSLNLLILSVNIIIIFIKFRVLRLIFIAGERCKAKNFLKFLIFLKR